jgi:integrating conjugative element protein (TIGR03759 family)
MKPATILWIWALAGGLTAPVSAVETVQTQIGTPQVVPTQTDAVARTQAAQWGLNLDEYRRYEALMLGMRGSISDPRISPIEVLGIHARSDAERQKYAEIFARMMAEDAERILQFQAAYQASFKRMYPNLPVIYIDPATNRPPNLKQVLDAAPKQHTVAVTQKGGVVAPNLSGQPGVSVANLTLPAQVTKGDRLIVFTAPNCAMCEPIVNQAKAHVPRGINVDIYVVGAKTANDVASYANQIRIDPQLVRTGGLTLNVDNGTMARVLPTEKSLPQIVRKRGELITALSANEL